MKEAKYYEKIGASGNSRKIMKILKTGEYEEKRLTLLAMGRAASGSDAVYNQLVQILQAADQKEDILLAVEAISLSGKSTAISQLEFMIERNSDPEVDEAMRKAIRTIRNS